MTTCKEDPLFVPNASNQVVFWQKEMGLSWQDENALRRVIGSARLSDMTARTNFQFQELAREYPSPWSGRLGKSLFRGGAEYFTRPLVRRGQVTVSLLMVKLTPVVALPIRVIQTPSRSVPWVRPFQAADCPLWLIFAAVRCNTLWCRTQLQKSTIFTALFRHPRLRFVSLADLNAHFLHSTSAP